MYRIAIRFHRRLMRGEIPIPYIIVNTLMGYRAYAEKELMGVFAMFGHLADGTVLADGSQTAGASSLPVLEKSARVIYLGGFDRTVSPVNAGLLIGYTSKQKQHVSVDLDNGDLYFSRLLPKEPFLGAELLIYLGFESDPQNEHLKCFSGIISIITMGANGLLTLEADER